MTTRLRKNEKQFEEQQETVENLEKTCDNHLKQAAENAETVSSHRVYNQAVVF